MNLKNNFYVELHVPDFDVVKDFYGKLGFEVVWEKRSKEKPRTSYLVMKLEQSIVCFWPGNEEVWKQTYMKNFPSDTKRGYGVELVFYVNDLKSIWNKAKESAKISQPIKLKEWGKKDFRIEDPFGYYLRFTEPYDILKDQR